MNLTPREKDKLLIAMAAIVALARVSGKDVYHTVPGKTPAPDKALQAKMFASLDRIDVGQLTYQEKLDLLRSYSLVMIRLGAPDEPTRQRHQSFTRLFSSRSRYWCRRMPVVDSDKEPGS